MLCPVDLQIIRSSAGCNDEIFSLDLVKGGIVFIQFWEVPSFKVLVNYLWVFRANQGILILEGS